MIEIKYLDRLGNKLFQYCLGRILAERHGFELKANLIEGFKNIIPLDGTSHDTPSFKYIGHKIPFVRLYKDETDRKIVLQGWFQRYDYYKRHASRIKKWLWLPPIDNHLGITDKDVCIHIRLKDYVVKHNEDYRFGRALRHSWYDAALSKIDFDRVFICTDDPNNRDFLSYFDKYNPIYVHGNTIDTLRTMKLFNKIVLSMSTFSWWGAYLSDAQEIVFPITRHNAHGYWGTRTQINLKVPEDRYIYINDQLVVADTEEN